MNARSCFYSIVVALASVGCLLVSSAASALPPVAGQSEATRIFQEGVRLSNLNEYEAARKAFAEAYQKGNSPRALFNLASMERKAGMRPQSAEHFVAYLGLPASDKIDEETRKNAAIQLVELTVVLCTVNLLGPALMQVKVDARQVRGTVAYMEPGKAMVEFAVNGMIRKREAVCGAGEKTTVAFDDMPSAPGAGAPAASMTVTEPGFGAVKPPEVVPPKAEPETSRSGGLLIAAIGTGVVGVGGVVLGGVFGSQSSSLDVTRRQLAAEQPGRCNVLTSAACAKLKTASDDGNSKHSLSIVSFVAGGVMLGAATVFSILYLQSSKEANTRQSTLGAHVRIAPTTNGVVAFGEF